MRKQTYLDLSFGIQVNLSSKECNFVSFIQCKDLFSLMLILPLPNNDKFSPCPLAYTGV